jgi:hypothetical protein
LFCILPPGSYHEGTFLLLLLLLLQYGGKLGLVNNIVATNGKELSSIINKVHAHCFNGLLENEGRNERKKEKLK